MTWDTTDSQRLFAAILQLESVDEAKRFFRDLLTEAEIAEFAKRWTAARLLDRGTPYREIQRRTGLSSRTVARITRWLTAGEGGYRLLLDRTPDATTHHTPRSTG